MTNSGPYPQPKLIDQLGSIARMVGGADRRVGRSAFEYYEALRGQIDQIRAELDSSR